MAVTYEQIKKANESLKLTPIKGKDYAEVNQRIKGFRMVYPEGFIITSMTQNEDGLCVFTASVGYYDEHGEARTIGTGTAFEERQASYINKTSYIENCETSAVGRALGMAGFGIDTAICSAEELNNALEAQEEVKKAEAKQLKPDYDPDGKVDAATLDFITKAMSADRLKKMCEHYGIVKASDLTKIQAGKVLNGLKKEGVA